MEAKDILFRCEYLNVAWGVQFDGIFITRGGQVYRFGEKAGAAEPPFDQKLSLAEYLAWVSQHAILESQVDPAELDQKARLIEAAARGKIVPEVGTIDAGVWSFCAYRIEGGRLEEILLGSAGDHRQINQSPQAAELIAWLTGVWGVNPLL
jgi:hypothetical protein